MEIEHETKEGQKELTKSEIRQIYLKRAFGEEEYNRLIKEAQEFFLYYEKKLRKEGKTMFKKEDD